ncbi:MAG TPA: aminopeptidase N [Pseudoclavibacter sp.]|nr:aminopeptidase N [Pseudoclavibacter sp.]
MPGENLTRVEAAQRRSVVTTESYDIALDLTSGEQTFHSTTVIRFTATPGESTFLDAVGATLHSITHNGRSVPVENYDGARIQIDNLESENEVVVDGDFRYVNTGEGLHRFVDPVDGQVYLYSQFEVPDARKVYANFEQPDLKAQFTFTITAPKNWVVVSNTPAAEPEPSGEDALVWRFQPTQRISTYITAIVAGPYVGYRSELTSTDGRTIPLGVYCRASLAEHLDAEYIFDITRKGFAFFEKEFNWPYPFEKYDQLFVPEFNAGAMENAGCVTHTEAYVFRSKVPDAMRERRVVTILHELAHMWFGDLVTMKWWNDLWLNESFAEFMSTLATAEATEWSTNWATFNSSEKSWAYRQDQLPSTHPIVAPITDLNDVQVNFDGITYAKGASVLKQLVAWVGRDHFFQGVHQYFLAHAHGNTELNDLLTELAAASGRDLASWSKLWLETAGVNTLRLDLDVDDAGVIRSAAVVQTTPAEHPVQRPHRLGIGFYGTEADQVVRSAGWEVDIDGERTEIAELVGKTRPALILLNDNDLAYAKIRLDADSHAFSLTNLSRIADPLARALIWGAEWDATRDAETPASDFVTLVLENIGAETESTVVRTVLGQLLTTATMYVSPQKRQSTLRQVADTLWQLARTAPGGSDRQFQFVRHFAFTASTQEHGAILAQLRSGEITLPGLEIDTDLDWELLIGLVALGEAGEDDIAAARTKDPTATGGQAAARALASIPTVQAKLAALDRLTQDETLPNLILRNTASGLLRANDPALLEAIVEPYFERIVPVWDARSFHISEEIIDGAFPAPLATRELLDRAQQWLDENPDQPSALRRMIIEGAASVQRALDVQSRDA